MKNKKKSTKLSQHQQKNPPEDFPAAISFIFEGILTVSSSINDKGPSFITDKPFLRQMYAGPSVVSSYRWKSPAWGESRQYTI